MHPSMPRRNKPWETKRTLKTNLIWRTTPCFNRSDPKSMLSKPCSIPLSTKREITSWRSCEQDTMCSTTRENSTWLAKTTHQLKPLSISYAESTTQFGKTQRESGDYSSMETQTTNPRTPPQTIRKRSWSWRKPGVIQPHPKSCHQLPLLIHLNLVSQIWTEGAVFSTSLTVQTIWSSLNTLAKS